MVSDVVADELPRKDFGKSVSLRLPINDWLRKQFDIIEDFVRHNADLTNLPSTSSDKVFTYKPLWRGYQMYISVSPLCSFNLYNTVTGKLQSADLSSMNGKGTYSYCVSVPYIYIGAHKNGEDYSLSLEITSMILTPDVEPEVISTKAQPRRRRPKGNALLPQQAEAKA